MPRHPRLAPLTGFVTPADVVIAAASVPDEMIPADRSKAAAILLTLRLMARRAAELHGIEYEFCMDGRERS